MFSLLSPSLQLPQRSACPSHIVGKLSEVENKAARRVEWVWAMLSSVEMPHKGSRTERLQLWYWLWDCTHMVMFDEKAAWLNVITQIYHILVIVPFNKSQPWYKLLWQPWPGKFFMQTKNFGENLELETCRNISNSQKSSDFYLIFYHIFSWTSLKPKWCPSCCCCKNVHI